MRQRRWFENKDAHLKIACKQNGIEFEIMERCSLRDCRCAAAVLEDRRVAKTKMASASAGGAGVAREETSSRVSFTSEETAAFLAIVSEMNISEHLDSRRQRNQAYFQKIEAEMSNLRYRWSWQQLRTHWKNLKARYSNVCSGYSFFSLLQVLKFASLRIYSFTRSCTSKTEVGRRYPLGSGSRKCTRCCPTGQ